MNYFKRKIKENLNKHVNLAKSIVQNPKGFIDKVKYGNTDFPFSFRQELNNIGNQKITDIQIIRAPISKTLLTAMNAMSGFVLQNKLNNSPYDSLFHLKLRINGLYDYEKEAIVKLAPKKDAPNQEYLPINPNLFNGLSISQFVQNHVNLMGMKNYLHYDGRTLNCQNFVLNALHANNINDPTYDNWLLQNTEFVFENNPNPLFHQIMNKITDIGNRFNIIEEGTGLLGKKGTLTNYDIITICKSLKLSLVGVFMKDEIDN